MATCPHCGTENKDNAIFCVTCRKPLPKRSRQAGGTKPIAERVPVWLTDLLAKHKEYPGPLLGLEPAGPAEMAPPPRIAPKPAEHEADVSALLAQLAAEGAPAPAGDRLASSVEWGAYGEAAGTEPPAPTIDDFLADMEVSPAESYVQYEPPPVEPVRPDLDVPDWLSEGLTTPPPQPRSPSPPAPELSHADVPDWLTESSADFASPTPAVELEPGPALDEHDVPDWLNETTTLPATQALEPSPVSATQAEPELPDWLGGDLEISPSREEPGAPIEAEALFPAESPAWLDNLPPDEVDTVLVAETGFEAEIPDWISAIVPPTSDALEPQPQAEELAPDAELTGWNVPDWIAAAQMTDEEEAELTTVTPPTGQARPDWLELEGTPPVELPDLPDWLSPGAQPSPAAQPAAWPADDSSAADWLADLGSSGQSLADDQPDWLGEADTAAPALQPPDATWLVGEDQPPPPPAAPAEPTEAEETGKPRRPLRRLKPLTRLSPQQPAPPPQPAPPDWVTGLVPADFTEEPAGAEGQPPPAWAADLAPPSAASLAKGVAPPPDWVQQLVPPGFKAEVPPPRPLQKIKPVAPEPEELPPEPPTNIPVLPESELPADEAEDRGEIDWVAQFSHSLPGTGEFAAATADLSPELAAEPDELVDDRLDWLAGESEAESSPEPVELDEEATPDWLAELATPAAATEEDAEIPDWLAELPALDSEEAVSSLPPIDAEIGRPDWLSELPETAATAEPEAPDWLAELPADDEAVEPLAADVGEEELVIPPWFGHSAETITPDAALTPTGDELELETPDWLAELEQSPVAATELPEASSPQTAVTPSTPAEAEFDAPPWMAELQPASSTQVEEPPAAWMAETAEEAELPDWISALRPAPVETEQAELPDWLSELGAAPVETEEVAPSDQPAEAAVVAPELVEAEPTELDLPESIEPELPATEEEELPDWLAELPPVSAEAAEPGLPDWLVAATETPAETTAPAVEPSLDEVEEGAEYEGPDWPASLAVRAALTFDQGEPEPVAEATESVELPEEPVAWPDWLSELRELPSPESEPVSGVAAEEQEVEPPDWLAELSSPPTEAAEVAAPAWLSQTLVPIEEKTVVEAGEAELETPDWLAEPAGAIIAEEAVAPPPVGEEFAEPAPVSIPETAEAELPDWLSQLRVVSAEETTTGDEMPDWPAESFAGPEAEEMPGEAADEARWAAGSVRFDQEQAAEVELAVAEPEPFEQLPADEDIEALPDWLTELPAIEVTDAPEQATEPPEIETAVPATVAELLESPDWLADVMPVEAEEAAGLPDWLVESTATALTEETVPGEAELADETPEWLIEPSQPIAAMAETVAETEVEPPPWLAEQPTQATEPAESTAAMMAETTAETEVELPPWLAELPAGPAEPAEPTAMMAETTAETEVELPPWLAELPAQSTEPADAAGPEELGDETVARSNWLARLSATLEAGAPLAEVEAGEAPTEIPAELPFEEGEAETVEAEAPDWLAELGEDAASEEALVIPDWLTGGAVVETIVSARWREGETPAQPAGEVEQIETEAEVERFEEAVAPTEAAGPVDQADLDQALDLAGEPQLPDWLTDSEATAGLPSLVEEKISATELVEDQEVDVVEPAAPPAAEAVESEAAAAPAERREQPPPQARLAAAKPKSPEKKRVPGGVDSSTAEADDEALKVAEATGVLAGLSSLLPAQEVMAGAAMTALSPQAVEGQKDAVLEAAREFQAIATRVPQPVTLPAPLTRRDNLFRGGARAGLYLLFIILIAIPLLPGVQKITSSGQLMAWTEPTGSLAEVLDRQRRELISSELGVVDFQQPGSVALVSFDYTPATQGEMQPLADAVLGRLRGQGMRLIFVSLETEGAAVAQQTLERLLAERTEAYGTSLVNLGYLPGQVVAVRALANGRPLADLVDPNTGQPFGQGETANWNDVENIAQVDMVVTLADNPTTSRWWIEQLAAVVEPEQGERFILAATSAMAQPYLQPYRNSGQLDGLVAGINGAAAIEASRKNFGPARQMLDSQSIAHLLIIILIAAGTMVGWMPPPEQRST